MFQGQLSKKILVTSLRTLRLMTKKAEYESTIILVPPCQCLPSGCICPCGC